MAKLAEIYKLDHDHPAPEEEEGIKLELNKDEAGVFAELLENTIAENSGTNSGTKSLEGFPKSAESRVEETLAVRVGFEPTKEGLPPYSLSRRAPSTARPPHRK